ncbi:MAG: TonB-dependent receptor [Deltaproteobacteria bacterium]
MPDLRAPRSFVHCCSLLVAALAAAACSAAGLAAQGLSGAALTGRVAGRDGRPIADARLTLVEPETGHRFSASTTAAGRFTFEALAPGDYRLDAAAIGFEPLHDRAVFLRLGERLELDLALAPVSVTLPDITVTAGASDAGSGAGGPAATISRRSIEHLPLLDRDLAHLLDANVYIVPGRVGGFSISGQGSRFNSIQIDGGIANDVYGVDAAGTPGSQAGGRAISPEAVREIQVAVAPFDVREGGFSGGLINAVTRSGTNRFEARAFGAFERADLVGDDTAGVPADGFHQNQYGIVVGGPIVRDRLHFFAVADLQDRAAPYAGPSALEPTPGVSPATAERVRTAIRNRFGFDPGGPDAPILGQPADNWFAKLSWQPAPGHVLELSYNRVDGDLDQLNRTVVNRVNRDGWQLANSGSRIASRSDALRLRAVSARGPVANELLLSYQTAADDQAVPNRVPLFLVQADLPNVFIAAGSDRTAQQTTLHQRVAELTDNVTVPWRRHSFTIGAQAELFHFRDVFFPASLGVWTFASADALETGDPFRYEVALPLRPGGPAADFGVRQVGAYVQDWWTPLPRLEVTLGLRWDVAFADHPPTNPDLLASSALGGIDTGELPSGNGLLSPRLGFRFAAGGATTLRGGIGLFTGRPPFVWLGQAFANTGREQVTLVCAAANGVPAPTADIAQLPETCTGTGGPVPTPASVVYFDHGFRLPQTLKAAVGADRDLGGGWTASADVVGTWSRHQLYVEDVNLVPGETDAEGRLRYGGVGTGGAAVPLRVDAAFGPVLRLSDGSGDRSVMAVATVHKRFRHGELSAGYAWSRSRDVLTALNPNPSLILLNNALDGTLAERNLRPSGLDVPHRIAVSGSVDLPLGFGLGLIYSARSGTPYSYVVTGDANADGFASNDLVYVPRDASDILLADPSRFPALDAFIRSEPCLASQRGRIMPRNSCRNPWVTSLDLRLEGGVGLGGRRLALLVDVFNLPNLLDGGWGLVRQTARVEELPLLSVIGYDAAARRPIYSVPVLNGAAVFPALRQVQTAISRWQIQIGARFTYAR